MSAVPAEIAPRGRGGRIALPVRADAAAALATAVAVAALGVAAGGYYPTAWSVATVAALTVGVVTAMRSGRVATSPLLLGLIAFTGWVAVESARAGAATRGLLELERDVLYVAVAWSALQVIRTRTAASALTGVLSATCMLTLDGLYRLLLPFHISADAFEGRLLFRPLGYANASGVVAAIGVVLALGAAARSRLAAVALVPLMLGLALSESRGAALALAAGLAAAATLHPQRGELAGTALVLLPVPTALAAFALRSHVTSTDVSSSVVARDCVVVAAAACVAAIVQALLAARLRRFAVPTAAAAAVAVTAFVAAVAVTALRLGDRAAYWHVAWLDARAHPWLGSGPGTFARAWLANRSIDAGALNAHNLYLETLAELGPLGLALLVAALATPLFVAVRRRSPLAAVAAGGYVTFLAHAAVDWDWQMPAVTIAGFLCGICALRAASPVERLSTRALRPALALASVLALGVAAAGVGNAELSAAARTGDASAARRAAALQPWSAEPQRLLAELALAGGRPAEARGLLLAALRRDPADATAWYDLVLAGTPAQRRTAAARYAQLDPLAVRVRRVRAAGAGSP
jgi:hypothetical protein